MDNFVISARKYRPTVFDHVVGQSHITTTLKNAIQRHHLAQAFLFCGPRGVGKTTCARILAKTINCQQVTADIAPCNTCTFCTSFNNNTSFNVYELDAASNNSVEDIRTLVEQVRYPPQTGKYKIYIIDEVHMLSGAAFNAFLKTLEEPPRYVIFILATTEKHKIIPTVLSRCQIFDFHRIQPPDIVQYLKKIAQQKGIAYEEEALYLMGQKADGSLRDALSMFDLITTFSWGKSVTLQTTRAHLHTLDYRYYLKLTGTFLQCNPGNALLIYDEILKKGFDGHHFITGLSGHFRNLMMSLDPNTTLLLAVADRVKKQYQTQAKQAGLDFLLKALGITSQCDLHYKSSNNKRLHIEIALIELAHIQKADLLVENTERKPIRPCSQSEDLVSSSQSFQTSLQVKHIEEKENIVNNVIRKSTRKTSTLQPTIKIPKIDQLKQTLHYQPTTSAPAESANPTVASLPISQDKLHQHWHSYAQKLKLAGRMAEYSLMTQAITLTDATIEVQLVNAVQQDILAAIQEELTIYLRHALQSPELKLQGIVIQPEKDRKPYTVQEKFQYLLTKYPDLRILQEKLALEVQE
mmetsp:Transcript_4512/g.10202  ORF Transcript_4512/g.10202 Transcript_4512/m.10202 type:complete len:580 (-) Transcript_4512:42-1781(-)